MNEQAPPTARGKPDRESIRWTAWLALLYGLLVVPAIWIGTGQTDDAEDQRNYHEPYILKLAADWPQVDLKDTHGLAMTPGYHLALAALKHYTGCGITALRFATAGLGFLLVWSCLRFTAQWTQPRTAFLLITPLLLSSFVLGSAMWLRPDNIALWAVVAVLGLTLQNPVRPGLVVWAGLLIGLGVAVRQVNIWLLAPLGLQVLLSLPPFDAASGAVPQLRSKTQWAGLIAAALLAVAIPAGVLGYFYQLWGGLLPPAVAAVHPVGRGGLKILPVILAITGFFGVCFIPLLRHHNLRQLLCHRWVIGAACLGVLAAMLPRTGDPVGPSGFLVQLQKTPVFYGRVLVLIPFAAIGGAVLAVLVRAAIAAGRARPAWMLLFSYLIWAITMTANVYVFRRYCEPFILLCLAWWSAMALPDGAKNWRSFTGPGIVILLQSVATTAKIYWPVLRSL